MSSLRPQTPAPRSNRSNKASDPLEHSRSAMVNMLRTHGIRDRRVLDVMATVPRHAFVPKALARAAYDDDELCAPEGEILSQPRLTGLMIEALELQGHERVLEVGTGSGYHAALLGSLAREVYSLEAAPNLVHSARERLESLGYRNVQIIEADGTKGWVEAGPYQAILVSGGSSFVPPELVDQLDQGGRLVIPIGDENGQLIERIRKTGCSIDTETLTWSRLLQLDPMPPSRPSWPWLAAASRESR